MTFDPQRHIIQLSKGSKNPTTGAWETTLTDYLPVAARVAWFRAEHPGGTITTEIVTLDWDKGLAIFKTTVTDEQGGVAEAYAHETRSEFQDFLEKASTRSVGRALDFPLSHTRPRSPSTRPSRRPQPTCPAASPGLVGADAGIATDVGLGGRAGRVCSSGSGRSQGRPCVSPGAGAYKR